MKKTLAVLLITAIFTGLSCLTSCKSGSSEKEQKKIEMEQVKNIEGQIESNVYPLPSSAEVIKMLTELEVGYIFGVANPVENTKKYLSSTSRALNLGVYGADLSYATLYNIQQEIINYLDAIRVLANELNMSKIYNEALYEDIKKNYDNKDQLVGILTTSFNET